MSGFVNNIQTYILWVVLLIIFKLTFCEWLCYFFENKNAAKKVSLATFSEWYLYSKRRPILNLFVRFCPVFAAQLNETHQSKEQLEARLHQSEQLLEQVQQQVLQQQQQSDSAAATDALQQVQHEQQQMQQLQEQLQQQLDNNKQLVLSYIFKSKLLLL